MLSPISNLIIYMNIFLRLLNLQQQLTVHFTRRFMLTINKKYYEVVQMGDVKVHDLLNIQTT